jgi:small subunit ribosomal protein S17
MDRNRQRLIGKVVSDSMDKTLVVSVERLVKHKLYKKYIRQSKKYYAHDEDNSYENGDLVEIISSKPLSKTKRWRVSRLTEKNEK